MMQFLQFVKKETFHIWRDKKTLFVLLVMPVIQIIVFGFALTNEVKNTTIAILDYAQDDKSRSLSAELSASRYFEVSQKLKSDKEIDQVFKRDKAKLVVVFPAGFSRDLHHLNLASVQLIADASDPNVANTLTSYASQIIQDFESRLNANNILPYQINTEWRMLYNPQMKGAFNFVPGVMAMVLLLVCTMMTAITIVREKEMGTMEVLLVSPVRPLSMVLAKMIPYLILSLVNIGSILLLSRFVLEVPINGSLFLLVMESILFTLVSLTLGLFISTKSNSQQTAMLISLVALFLPTVMLSGFMFPIENMPLPLRIFSNLVPAKWYYSIVKSVMIKGLPIAAIWRESAVLLGMLVLFFTLAIRQFKIRLE